MSLGLAIKGGGRVGLLQCLQRRASSRAVDEESRTGQMAHHEIQVPTCRLHKVRYPWAGSHMQASFFARWFGLTPSAVNNVLSVAPRGVTNVRTAFGTGGSHVRMGQGQHNQQPTIAVGSILALGSCLHGAVPLPRQVATGADFTAAFASQNQENERRECRP